MTSYVAGYATGYMRLMDAIQAHHDTKYGSNPATGRSVISPPDKALYIEAGIAFQEMMQDQPDARKRLVAVPSDPAACDIGCDEYGYPIR